jgi:HK97 family phage portal protein
MALLFKRKKNIVLDQHFQEVFTRAIRSYPITKNPTILSIVHSISNTISTLGLEVSQRTRNGVIKIFDEPLLLTLEHPNATDSATQFLYLMTKNYLESGNTYIYHDIGYLQILPSAQVQVVGYGENKQFIYDGRIYTTKNIIHIYNPQYYDGQKGHSAIEFIRELIELDNMLIFYIDKYFHNTAGSRLTVELDKEITSGLKDESLKKEFDKLCEEKIFKTSEAGKPLFLISGMKIGKIDQPTNAESELSSLLTRTEREIAKPFGYPLYKLTGDYGNNLQSQQTNYLQTSILPITEIFSEWLTTLLDGPFSQYQKLQFDYSNILMPDIETQHKIIRDDRRGGLITLNEARTQIHRGIYDGSPTSIGDALWREENMAPAINTDLLPKENDNGK